MIPKIVFTDIDGVWTDGGMYYDRNGNELKKFNTSDSAGVIFLHVNNIPVCIITGEDTPVVKFRAEKLKVDHVITGALNKLQKAEELVKKLGLTLDEAAFIGDDINDIPLLRKVGISAVPASASEYVKKEAEIIIDCNGGEGAFRLFVEKILSDNDLLNLTLEKIIRKLTDR